MSCRPPAGSAHHRPNPLCASSANSCVDGGMMRRGAYVSEEGRSGVPTASDPLLRKAVASDLEGAGGKLDVDGGLDSRQSPIRHRRGSYTTHIKIHLMRKRKKGSCTTHVIALLKTLTTYLTTSRFRDQPATMWCCARDPRSGWL
jgi:hypothetical protein